MAAQQKIIEAVQSASTSGESIQSAALPNLLGADPSNFAKAKNVALNIENIAREAVSVDDPACRALRHYNPGTSASRMLEGISASPDITYVNPESIQSNMSPAAYLTYIYDVARTQISHSSANRIYSLDSRRPNLKNFEMTEDSLAKEITTLSLVNKILSDQLKENDIADGKDLSDYLSESTYPMTLPFNINVTTITEDLKAIGDIGMNEIVMKGSVSPNPLLNNSLSLTPVSFDILGLHPEDIKIISKPFTTHTERYRQLYGMDPALNPSLTSVQFFCGVTNISFQDLRELIRDDVLVYDEADKEEELMYAKFLSLSTKLELENQGEGDFIVKKKDNGTIISDMYEVQNKCIRLKNKTGIAYKDLDWLLMNALYTHNDYDAINGNKQQRKVLNDGTGFSVLAHYIYYEEKFGLDVDEFCAMLGDINCYRRAGENEETLMKKLFGSHAPYVTKKTRRYEPEDPISLQEADEGTEKLGEILREGFKLSRNEWDVLVSIVSGSLDDTIDSLWMGRIYRVSKLFRVLGWGISEGIQMLEIFSRNYLNVGGMDAYSSKSARIDIDLGSSVLSGTTLTAIDRCVCISDWMKENDLSPSDMVLLSSQSDQNISKGMEEILNKVKDFKQQKQSVLFDEEDFFAFGDLGI